VNPNYGQKADEVSSLTLQQEEIIAKKVMNMSPKERSDLSDEMERAPMDKYRARLKELLS
jgi:hypothetical protein